MTIQATKVNFVVEFAKACKTRYAWAQDQDKLNAFATKLALCLGLDGTNTVSLDGDAAKEAWLAIGMKGKPTFKALRALPPGV